jgi:hypothetical protein
MSAAAKAPSLLIFTTRHLTSGYPIRPKDLRAGVNPLACTSRIELTVEAGEHLIGTSPRASESTLASAPAIGLAPVCLAKVLHLDSLRSATCMALRIVPDKGEA